MLRGASVVLGAVALVVALDSPAAAPAPRNLPSLGETGILALGAGLVLVGLLLLAMRRRRR